MKVRSRAARPEAKHGLAFPLRSVLPALFVLGATVAIFPQEADTLFRVAPNVPLPEGPVESIILRHIPVGGSGTPPVRIVRHGFPGSPVRPNMLDLPPDDGSFVEVHAYDWLRVQSRPVEFRTREAFLPLVTLHAQTQVLVIDETRLELLHGSLNWQRRHPDAPDFAVTAGAVTISGRGDATFERFSQEISVAVHSGRIDIAVDGVTIAVLGAGQTRTVPLSPERELPEPAEFEEALGRLRATLDASLEMISDGSLTGSDLAELWARVVPVAVLFSELETATDSSVNSPDIVMRDIGEAFRILGGYRFDPAASSRRS